MKLMRDSANKFPEIDNAREISSLMVWHCKYKNFLALEHFTQLEELVIATFPDESLDVISRLSKLRYLRILHMPKIKDVSSIITLPALESLSLATLPSWDASGKLQIMTTLEPLSRLAKLKHLELLGVMSAQRSLRDVEQCAQLQSARFAGFPAAEVERFYANRKVLNAFNPEPRLLHDIE